MADLEGDDSNTSHCPQCGYVMAAEIMVALTEVVVPLLCLLQAEIERSQLAEKTIALRDEVIRLEEECQFLQDQVSSTSC